MGTKVERQTVDLSGYPDLVVIYLGMCVNRITGMKTLLGFGPKINASAAALPDGLLRHEAFVFSLFPMHVGIRQYWRDTDSLVKWTRSDPHRQWWRQFLKDSGGTGFWHETYFRRGGMEAIYDDVSFATGLKAFARWLRRAGRCSERPRALARLSRMLRWHRRATCTTAKRDAGFSAQRVNSRARTSGCLCSS